MQKMVYLLTVLGCDLGYDFNWYKYGPYSPELTRDAYTLQSMHSDEVGTNDSQIPAAFPSRIGVLHGMLVELKAQSPLSSEAELLELCASLVYLARQFRYGDTTLKHILLARKPKFAQATSSVELLLATLRRYNLVH
jgi:hypothetical protein